MNTERAYNKKREQQTLFGTKAQRRKKYKKIIEELGARQISTEDLLKLKKIPGILEVMDTTGMTFDDLVITQQYAKAIYSSDTKAAEFLRDTVGEKPSSQVDITSQSKSPLQDMSLEELMAFREELHNAQSQLKKDE